MLLQLNGFIEKGFGGVAIRPGKEMVPAYLSDEFFDIFKLVLSTAKTGNIGVRIADDFSLPWNSFFSNLTEQNSLYRAQKIELVTYECFQEKCIFETTLEDPDNTIIFTAKSHNGKIQPGSIKPMAVKLSGGKNRITWQVPSANWNIIIFRKRFVTSPGKSYSPNIFNPKVAQTYIKTVLEQFKYRFSRYLPGTFEGFITEIPAFIPSDNAIPWDDDLIAKYRTKYKKDMMKIVPLLFCNIEDKSIKNRSHLYNYLSQAAHDRFTAVLESWAKRYRLSQWVLTPERGIHLADNNMLKYCFAIPQSRLASVGSQNQEGLEASYPIYRTVSDINSVEFRQETVTVIGRNRNGEGATIQSLKTEIDRASACGHSKILIDGCFFNITHRNYIRTPVNPSWYYPGWDKMKSLCDYSARIQGISKKIQENRHVAILFPGASIMSEYTPSNDEAVRRGNASLQKVINALERQNISYDVISETKLLSCSIRANGEFGTSDRVRKGNYKALVIPYARLINKSLHIFVERLAVKKGTVIFIDEPPQGNIDDGVTASFSDRVEKLLRSKKGCVHCIPAKELPSHLKNIERRVNISINGKPCQDICAVNRIGTNHELFTLYNRAEKRDFFATIELPHKNYYYYVDCLSGELHDVKSVTRSGKNSIINLSFAPSQTYFLVGTNSKQKTKKAKKPARKTKEQGIYSYNTTQRNYRIVLKDQWTFVPESLNVLPLANWNMRIGLSRESGGYTHYSESYFEVKEPPEKCVLMMCGFPANPGRNIVGEPIELTVNGNVCEPYVPQATVDKHGHDKDQFETFCGRNTLKYSIREYLIRGFNRVSIRTPGHTVDPQAILYPPLIAGTFSIGKGPRGWTIDVPKSAVGYDSWTRHGFPYLSGTGAYIQKFEIPSNSDRIILKFSHASGVVNVVLNSVDIGTLIWQPMEIDITGKCDSKRNEIQVRVINTLDNILRLNGRPSGLLGEAHLDIY